MGLHGKGLWGWSSANTKGNKRAKCPICGKITVVGAGATFASSRDGHSYRIVDGNPVLKYCPKEGIDREFF